MSAFQRRSGTMQRSQVFGSSLLAVLLLGMSVRGDDICEQLFRKLALGSVPVPTSDVELSKASDERACILTFPWPNRIDREKDDLWNQPTSVLIEARKDFARLDQVYQEKYHRFEPTFKKLSYEERISVLVKVVGQNDLQKIRYLAFRLGGGSTKQLDLYAAMHLVKGYCAEGKYREALTAVKEVRDKYGLSLKVRGIDKLEGHSYLSEQTLENFLGGFEYRARLETLVDSPSDRLDLIADYLDHREALELVTGLAIGPGDLDDRMTTLLKNTRLPLEGNDADVLEALNRLRGLAGFQKDGDGMTYYIQGKALHAIRQEGEFFEILDAEGAARTLRNHCRTTIQNYSNGEMTLFNVLPLAEIYEIELPDGMMTLTKPEYEQLCRGEALPASHPLSRAIEATGDKPLVSLSNPLALKTGAYSEAAEKLVNGLTRAYTKANIFNDPLSEKTGLRASALNHWTLRSPDDVLVVIADKTFAKVRDGNVILNLTGPSGPLKPPDAPPSLAKMPTRVYNKRGDASWQGARGKAVIVITGHSDEELRKFVQALGEDGMLRDNYVVFNSCETPLTHQLVVEMTARYGAAGVFSYEGKVFPREVKRLLDTFAEGLKARLEHGGVELPRILKDSILRAGMKGKWTICQVIPALRWIVDVRTDGLRPSI